MTEETKIGATHLQSIEQTKQDVESSMTVFDDGGKPKTPGEA